MAPLKIPKTTYKRFYEAHHAYFESTIANPDQLSFNEKYGREAKQLWADYGANRSQIKQRYTAGGDKSQIRYEPPRAANNYLGADAPAANQPVPTTLASLAAAALAQPVLSKGPMMVYIDIAPGPVRTDFSHDPGEAATVSNPLFPWQLNEPDRYFVYNGDASLRRMNDYIANNEQDEHEEENGPNTWRRVRTLGEGGWGTAYKWISVDEDGNRHGDSIIIKLVNYWSHWDKITAFSNDDRDVPREVAAHRTLWAPTDEDEDTHLAQSYVLGYRGFTLEKPYKYYRIASEEAVLGTLENVEQLFNVDEPKFRQFRDNIDGFDDPDYEFMPIHFVWRIFHALVKSLRHMHRQGLVHRDLKPANIFLTKVSDGEEDPVMGKWRIKPWLGDFGAAMPVKPVRYENPADFDEMWTPMFSAPEMHQGWPALIRWNDNGEPYPLTEKTDVFGLAMTMWSLMLCGLLDEKAGPLWGLDGSDNPKWDSDTDVIDGGVPYIWKWMTKDIHPADVANSYALNQHWMTGSESHRQLVALLIWCLKINPADRPSLVDVDDVITKWLHQNPDTDSAGSNSGDDDNEEPEVQPSSRFDRWFSNLKDTSNDIGDELMIDVPGIGHLY